MAVEIWKDIAGYEGLYQISNLGNVRNKSKTLKYQKDRTGYFNVILYKNKKRNTKKVHRLVAEAFIENTDKLPIINHINGIKTDNRMENLEWITYKNNSIHAVKNGLIKTKKVLCVETNKIYESIKEASKDTGVFDGHISKVCKGERKTTGGYHWVYVKECEL